MRQFSPPFKYTGAYEIQKGDGAPVGAYCPARSEVSMPYHVLWSETSRNSQNRPRALHAHYPPRSIARRIRTAAHAAPNRLSMFLHVKPAAHEANALLRAALPPAATP
jgi:hypothetical protein